MNLPSQANVRGGVKEMTFQTYNTCWMINQPVSRFPPWKHKPFLTLFWISLACNLYAVNLFFFLLLLLIAPKAKRQKQEAGVAKRLFDCQQSKAPKPSYDITPPSSPEHYEPSHTVRYERCVKWDRTWADRKTADVDLCYTVSFTVRYRYRIRKIVLIQLNLIKVVIFFVFCYWHMTNICNLWVI